MESSAAGRTATGGTFQIADFQIQEERNPQMAIWELRIEN